MSSSRPEEVSENLTVTDHDVNFTKMKRKDDYCRTYQNQSLTITIGTCEAQGERNSQEDYLAVAELENFDSFSPEEQTFILNEAFKAMQRQHGKDKQGSTGCVATAWIDANNIFNVVTANLGDSSAYYVILDKEGLIKDKARLNRRHNPDDEAEAQRIKADSGTIKMGRLGGYLAMSRAFGDNEYDGKGISHDCEIAHEKIELKDGDMAFIIVACDGLDLVDLYLMSNIVKRDYKSPATTANTLVNAGLNTEIRDNISVAFFKAEKSPTSAAVFDGHGGKDVSFSIGMAFYPCLKNYLHFVRINGLARFQAEIDKENLERQVAKENQKALQEENLQRIKNKFEACLAELTATIDFHIFIKFDNYHTKCGNLIFATDKDYDLVKKIETIAKSKGLQTSFISFCGNDDHPKRNRLAIILDENITVIPKELDEFISEIKPILQNEFGKKEKSKSNYETGSPAFYSNNNSPKAPKNETPQKKPSLN